MKFEHLITLRRGKKARVERGPVKRFGRSEYLARRLRSRLSPYFIAFDTRGTNLFNPSGTFDFSYGADGENWRLRPDDIMMAWVFSPAGASVSEGFEAITTGDLAIYWKRWKAGDPTTVTISLPQAEGYVPTVRLMTLRNAREDGNPFTVETATGTGRLVTTPGITAGTDDLIMRSFFHGGTRPPGNPSNEPEPFNPIVLDNRRYYYQSVSTYELDKIVWVGNPINGGALPDAFVGVWYDSGPWKGVTVKASPRRLQRRVLAGSHADTNRSFFPEYWPLLFEDDVVLFYTVSTSATITLPELAAPGWEPIASSPIQAGDKYLHVYWKRWNPAVDSNITVDYSSVGFLRLLTVARGARRSGNPFGGFAITTGSGTSINGGELATQKGQLVFFVTVAKFAQAWNNALGPLTALGVDEFEIDADSNSLFFFSWHYRTSSGYAQGSQAGPFNASFGRSADAAWTLTFTVLK